MMRIWLIVLGLLMGGAPAYAQEALVRAHAFSTFDPIGYAQGFSHFSYVNPDAPKGGRLRLAARGTFDSFNPLIPKGNAAAAAASIYDTLMVSSADEHSVSYGLVAEAISYPPDRSFAIFHLREGARFHDGHGIDAGDVVWSFNSLREKGSPLYRYYYANVTKVTALSTHDVRFDFKPGPNTELILILGQLPVLPEHYWQGRDFSKTTLEPPLGSGPYKIGDFKVGQSVTLARVDDYWARDLPVRRGLYNFDYLQYDYFRDDTVALEAFKARTLDLRSETSAKNWATAYNIPARAEGLMITREFAHDAVAPMQGIIFNQRRSLFQDKQVRKALIYAWDFEWVNAHIMYNAYQRTQSYFGNSPMAAKDVPSTEELAVLAPYRAQLSAAVFEKKFALPISDGTGNNRAQLRQAKRLLQAAGWEVVDGKLTHTETGAVMAFEILLSSDRLEPHLQPFVQAMQRLGGVVRLRIVDDAQYQNRLRSYDFDVVVSGFAQSHTPGNEQREYFGTNAAKNEGGRNI
ncbi:MAG: extracellular solute-binding protein, partial [Pseudomonadota bacterium]